LPRDSSVIESLARRDLRDDNRRHQLVRASARLFREKGYDGTSVRDIAQAAGMQSGSWVYHFPTKQDILVAVMEQGLADALARIEAIAERDQPPRRKFEALVRAHLDTILAPGQDFIPVLLYEWRSLEPGARRRVTVSLKRYERIWGDVIHALQQSGDWQGATRVDRLLLFGALNWMARWYSPGGRLDVAALARECVRFFLRTPARARDAIARPAARPAARRRNAP
jgi:TetR/AcrR family transcriptional regulator, cholesterol catabolism regulator